MRTYPPEIIFQDFPGELEQRAAAEREAGFPEIKVLFHSIMLEAPAWAELYKEVTGKPDTAYPNGAETQNVAWVQYRLNQLGYLCGPLTGKLNEQTRKAIRRYTYAHPDLEESGDPAGADFLNRIQRNDANNSSRDDLIHTRDALTDPRLSSPIIIDHDYYFANGPESPPQGESGRFNGLSWLEEQKLDRFEVPLTVKFLLLSKTDADGSGRGKWVPEAVGPARLEWHVTDPPENLGEIPNGSNAHKYIEKVRRLLAAQPDDAHEAQDNCPWHKGGQRMAQNPDVNYFHPPDNFPPFRGIVSGGKVYSFAHEDGEKAPGFVGRSLAFFRGSYIGGDNYVIKAALSFEGFPNASGLRADHLARAAKLARQTGKLTIWRRFHVERVIDWGDFPYEIDWPSVALMYRAAYILLVPPPAKQKPQPIAEVIRSAGAALAKMQEYAPERYKPVLKKYAGRLRFDPKAFCPLPFECIQKEHPKFPLVSALLEVKKDFITGDAYRLLMKFFGEYLPGLMRNRRPGLVVVCFYTFPRHADELTIEETPSPTKPFNLDPVPDCTSIGTDHGIACIDAQHHFAYTDRFLVAHEMGHCMYLTHALEAIGSHNHDGSDTTCAMFYPRQVGADVPWKMKDGGTQWGVRGYASTPAFCGKCLLKLRGWKSDEKDEAGGGQPPAPPGEPHLPRKSE